MKNILFLIHDLGHGGAEKVLVNLVNNLDKSKFDVTVIALFGGGVNEQFLLPHVKYHTIFKKPFPGNSHVMKLFSPKTLHKMCVKEHYDIEVSYLEGPSARIISGCDDKSTKLVSWIHIEQKTAPKAAAAFRSVKEAVRCYNRFSLHVGVSETVKQDFLSVLPISVPMTVLFNTNESEKILSLSREPVNDEIINDDSIKLVGVGKIVQNKGFDRLIRIVKRFRDEKYAVHLYLLGVGSMQTELKNYVSENGLKNTVTFLGYQTNPYKYVANCDLFVCSSHAEGFSTAATEALIVGTPVVTTLVSGMTEMLGENNEWGVITENSEEALYDGIKGLLDGPALLAHYKEKAIERGKLFSTKATVTAVEKMLERL